jgi:hypothetical protein
MTYGVDAFNALSAANGFYGMVSGNDSATAINGMDPNQNWGGGWTLAAKDNTDSSGDVANSVLGIAFAVDAGAKAAAGSWTLTGTGLTTSTVLMDILAVLKSSSEYALYYFEDVAFDGSSGGQWLSPAVNGNGQTQALSHMSIYVRSISESAGLLMPAGGPSVLPEGNAVPEPGSLALAGTALAALCMIRRRKARHG